MPLSLLLSHLCATASSSWGGLLSHQSHRCISCCQSWAPQSAAPSKTHCIKKSYTTQSSLESRHLKPFSVRNFDNMAVLGWFVNIHCMRHRVTCWLQIHPVNCPCKLHMNTAIKELPPNNRIQQYKSGKKEVAEGKLTSVWTTEKEIQFSAKLLLPLALLFAYFSCVPLPISFFYILSLSFSPLNSFQLERISRFLLTNTTLYIKVFSTLCLWLSIYFSLYILSLWILQELW